MSGNANGNGTTNGTHPGFTTTSGGIDHELPPMSLYRKALKLGVWDPRDIDLSRDSADWARLSPDEQDYLQVLLAQFVAGEEAVTLDLLPLIHAIASEGRFEEELYLTTFLFEEGKHAVFFRRFMDEVIGGPVDWRRYHTPAYAKMFYEDLPRTMNRLLTDKSREAQALASTTYNMFVEGVLAETGYFSFYSALDARKILPGLREGVRLIQRDESRHIGYGVYLLSRLANEDPRIYDVIERRMNELLPCVGALLAETYSRYQSMPFGLDLEVTNEFARSRFQSRMARIARAKEEDFARQSVESFEAEAAVPL